MTLTESLGGPFDVLASLDFESYFDSKFNMRKLTTEAYVRDPRFETLCVGVKWANAPAVGLEEWEFREWVKQVDWSRVALNSHHAHFDCLVLNHHYGVRPGFIHDTRSLGHLLHGPAVSASLKTLGPLYGLGNKGAELENARGKHRGDFTQAQWEAFVAYCVQDTELTHGLLLKMAPNVPAEELWLIDTTIRLFTEPVFIGDQAVLKKTHQHELDRKRAILREIAKLAGVDASKYPTEAEALTVTKKVLASKPKFCAVLEALGVEIPLKKNPKGALIPALAKADVGMKQLQEHEDERVRDLCEARLQVTSNIIETRSGRVLGVSERGPVTMYLKYAGAHTQRWSGGDKMNPQNFNRPDKRDPQKGMLRRAITVGPDEVIAEADSGQIEARVVSWLAGEEHLLETFRRNDRTNGDFYSDIGSTFFLKKLSKLETPAERQISKALVLGLGFNMGVFKCALELLKGMLGTDPVQFTQADADKFHVDVKAFAERPYQKRTCADEVRKLVSRLTYDALLIHCAVTDYFVRRYRDTNKRIVGLWKLLNDMLPIMASPGPWGKVRATYGPLRFVREGVIKPNGLTLLYPGLERSKDGWTYIGEDHSRTKIYGGLLTENLVQSLARDVVAEQALRIRARGYMPKMLTHDAIAVVTRKEDGPHCLSVLLEEMGRPPSWCPDLPLKAGGGFARSYGDISH